MNNKVLAILLSVILDFVTVTKVFMMLKKGVYGLRNLVETITVKRLVRAGK